MSICRRRRVHRPSDGGQLEVTFVPVRQNPSRWGGLSAVDIWYRIARVVGQGGGVRLSSEPCRIVGFTFPGTLRRPFRCPQQGQSNPRA